MAVPATAAAIAGVSAIGAYLDAKYHISQDLKVKRRKKAAAEWYKKLESTSTLSLWPTFTSHVPLHPHTLCIWSRTKSYTWQQVHDRAAQWGRYFLSLGVKPGSMVALYLVNSADFLVIWLGLWSIGCAPALLNYNLRGEGLVHCLRVSRVKIALVDADEECQGRYKEVEELVERELGVKTVTVDEALLDEIYATPVDVPDDSYRRGVIGSDPTCLLYTSGTTGLPKAGMYTVARYHERGNPSNLPFGQKPGPDGDRWYCCMPLFHGTGGLASLGAITGGMAVGVGRKFSVRTFWDDVCDSGATMFVYVGEAARYLLMAPKHPREREHRLRGMYGNGMRPDVWGRFQERFGVREVMEFFNSTEGVLGLVIWSKGPFTRNSVGHHGALLRRDLHDVLVPVAVDAETGEVARERETGRVKRMPYEVGGEILVKIPAENAFAGYFNNPAATAKKFERNCFNEGDLYYRSGDALRRDKDGRWFFLDRLGDTFRWKSENVSTAEVAEVLGRYPSVAEAMVYGVLVPGHDGRAGCVALRFNEGVSAQNFDFRGMLEDARAKLPRYAVPLFARCVGRSSNTDNQKQNKAPLREEGIELQKFGTRMPGGEKDVVLWLKPGAQTYELFGKGDLEALGRGKVTL